MNTKQLRQKILDLAIRGKLVPQDPNDEPASVLLERVRAEKERLIKEGKIKRDKRDSIITHGDKSHYENVPFDVPPGWVLCRLSSVAKVGTGATPLTSNRAYYDEGTIPWVTSGATSADYISKATAFITQKALDETNCTLYPPGTLVVAMYGEGKTRGQISELRIEAATNQACAAITPICYNAFIPAYVKACFIKYYDDLREQAKGAQQPNLNLSIVSDFRFPLPPLSEQHRIVAVIESAFAVIDEIEAAKGDLHSAVTAAKRKILSLAVRGKLIPQDPNDEPASVLLERTLRERPQNGKKDHSKELLVAERSVHSSYYAGLPKSWTVCRLDDVGSTNIGLTYKPKNICNNGVPVLRSTNIKNGSLDFTDLVRVNASLNENLELNEGDILICVRNGSRNLVGKCALVHGLPEQATFGAFMAVYRSFINNSYIYYFLHTDSFRSIFQSEGISTQINQLTQAMIRQTIIPLPPLAEQQRIVAAIKAAFEKLDSIVETLA